MFMLHEQRQGMMHKH